MYKKVLQSQQIATIPFRSQLTVVPYSEIE